MISAFLLQLSLYTTLYSPNHRWDEKEYRRGMVFIPLIGILLGLILYGTSLIIPDFLLGFSLLSLYCILSGGLHLDGFADTLDGVLARRGAKRALEIKKDPHLGTFGVLGLFLLLLAYFNYLPLIDTSLIILPAIGRFGGMVAGLGNKYARSEGMGKFFINSIHWVHIVLWLFILFGLGYYLSGIQNVICLSLCFIYAFIGGRWFKKKLSGMTGDTVGFIIESTQLLYIIFFLVVKQWI